MHVGLVFLQKVTFNFLQRVGESSAPNLFFLPLLLDNQLYWWSKMCSTNIKLLDIQSSSFIDNGSWNVYSYTDTFDYLFSYFLILNCRRNCCYKCLIVFKKSHLFKFERYDQHRPLSCLISNEWYVIVWFVFLKRQWGNIFLNLQIILKFFLFWINSYLLLIKIVIFEISKVVLYVKMPNFFGKWQTLDINRI